MVIHFKDISTSLGTRQLGAKLRTDIECSIKKHEKVSFDFDGVTVISNSFADECFGKLLLAFDMNTLRQCIVFNNTNEFIKVVINNSFSQRMNKVTH